MSEKQNEVIVTPFSESSLRDYDDYYRYELEADQAADHFLDRMEQEMKELSFLPNRYATVWKGEVREENAQWIREKRSALCKYTILSSLLFCLH